MRRFSVDYASCILTSNTLSSCTKCEDVCPDEVIKIDEEGLKYTPAKCIECAACFGACPTGSFSFESFSAESFCSDFALDDENLISCAKNLPCLAALNTEYLISFVLEKRREIILDIGHCDSCRIKESVFGHIQKSVDEANIFLEWFDTPHRVALQNLSFEAQKSESGVKLSRRELFSKLNIKDIIKTKAKFEKIVDEKEKKPIGIGDVKFDGESIRAKNRPFKRELFISATRELKDSGKDESGVKAALLSFISDKKIEKEECTNCALCYQICPSGALSGDKAKGKIEFDFLYCLSCSSCHDICPQSCINKEEIIKKEMFTEPKRKRLATFFMKNCLECGTLYINNGASKCARCAELDEEARELTGLKA